LSKSRSRSKPRARPPRDVDHPCPWVVGGVDYGPAVAALVDLARWAFDLASGDVADWPEGKRRVDATRRAVLADLHGRGAPATDDDLWFTAGLLARILDDALHLPPSDVVTVLDALGLPTDVVPIVPRRNGSRCVTCGRSAIRNAA
jgi:hypothetical protein